MMVHPQSLSYLKRGHTKPCAWLIETDLGIYTTRYSWGGDEWFDLHTSRGDLKYYRSSDAALADVWSVDCNASVSVVRPLARDFEAAA